MVKHSKIAILFIRLIILISLGFSSGYLPDSAPIRPPIFQNELILSPKQSDHVKQLSHYQLPVKRTPNSSLFKSRPFSVQRLTQYERVLSSRIKQYERAILYYEVRNWLPHQEYTTRLTELDNPGFS